MVDVDSIGSGYNSIYSPNQLPTGSAAQVGAFWREADEAAAASRAAPAYSPSYTPTADYLPSTASDSRHSPSYYPAYSGGQTEFSIWPLVMWMAVLTVGGYFLGVALR